MQRPKDKETKLTRETSGGGGGTAVHMKESEEKVDMLHVAIVMVSPWTIAKSQSLVLVAKYTESHL